MAHSKNDAQVLIGVVGLIEADNSSSTAPNYPSKQQADCAIRIMVCIDPTSGWQLR